LSTVTDTVRPSGPNCSNGEELVAFSKTKFLNAFPDQLRAVLFSFLNKRFNPFTCLYVGRKPANDRLASSELFSYSNAPIVPLADLFLVEICTVDLFNSGPLKPIFANPTPLDYSYDSQGDALYITFAQQKAARTFEVLDDWPMVLADVNNAGQIIGVEYIGVKQFGIEVFMRLLRERVKHLFGIELADEEVASFMSFMQTPEAEVALAG
jgi:uncharacterized protein YuzE